MFREKDKNAHTAVSMEIKNLVPLNQEETKNKLRPNVSEEQGT